MKKNLTIGALLSAMILLITGCGLTSLPIGSPEGKNEISDFVKTVQKAQTAKTDEEVAATIIGDMVDRQTQEELDNFNKTKSLDAPKGLPAELIYPNGKITSSEDSGSTDYTSLTIKIKTTDSLQTVQDYYKTALSKDTWKITKQSNENKEFNYFAKVAGSDYLAVSVWGSSTDYSKLIEVSVSYTGPTTE